MKTIRQTYSIKASLEKVWQAFIEPRLIDKWGAGPAKMSEEVGFKFSLWVGDIHGKNTEVIREKKLVQDWYAGNWPKPSKATFTFSTDKENTRVDLLHQDVPDEEYNEIDKEWKNYYLGPIKEMVENK